MIQLETNIRVKCKSCGYINEIIPDSFEEKSLSYERPMGIGTDYTFTTEYICNQCKKNIVVKIYVSEYPANTLERMSYECEGAQMIEVPCSENECVIETEYEMKGNNIDELIKECDHNYTQNIIDGKCKNCSHKNGCPGNCGKCLDEVHLSRGDDERQDYNCRYMLDYYVGKYMYAYVTENKRAFDIIENEIKQLPYIHMISIGCGPCPDLFGIVDFLKDKEIEKQVFYLGIEHNEEWKDIHSIIEKIFENEVKIKYWRRDAIEYFKKKDASGANILIMQYLVSHIVYNDRGSQIEDFFENLVKNVIMKMDSKSYIVINDINHNLARDKFDLLEQKIKQKGKKIKVYKYYFPYKSDLNIYQTKGMVAHDSNLIDYEVNYDIKDRYETRMHCRSVQHIIEVSS